MSLSLSIAIFLYLLHQTDARNINVSVRQYTGLKRSEIYGLENKYYNFEFCACPDSFTEKSLPRGIDQCTCSGAKRAKLLKNSIPTAKFFSSTRNCASGSCLGASLESENIKSTSKLFVRVLVSSNPLTSPEYQSIPFGSSKNEALLKTVRPSKIRLSYTATSDDSNEESKPKAKDPLDSWSNSVLHDPRGGASAFFSSLTSQKKMLMKTKATEVSGISNDVKKLNSIGSIKNYIFAKSRVDKVNPANYDTESLKEWIVTFHNLYRSKHSAPSLSQDPVLHSRGKRWADELAYHKGCLVHEQPRKYGENLFFFGARHLPTPQTLANAVVQSFYIEGIGYNYNSWRPMSYFKTGHFTQMIWQDSRKIGVGVSIVKSSSIRSPCVGSSPNMYLIFVVVKYDPPGNYETNKAYMENVKRPVA